MRTRTFAPNLRLLRRTGDELRSLPVSTNRDSEWRAAALLGEHIILPMPLCNMHRWYLNRYIVVVWVLAAVLAVAAVILVPLSLLNLFGHNQGQQGRAWVETIWLTATILLLPMVVIVTRLIRKKTVWCLDYTAHSIDLAGVDAKFAQAVQATSTSTVAGYGQPIGVLLPPGDGWKFAAIAVGTVACIVSGMCVLGFAASSFATCDTRRDSRRSKLRQSNGSSSSSPMRRIRAYRIGRRHRWEPGSVRPSRHLPRRRAADSRLHPWMRKSRSVSLSTRTQQRQRGLRPLTYPAARHRPLPSTNPPPQARHRRPPQNRRRRVKP
jgi:hypothetical protein